jgi:hypothetical protein
MFRSNVRSASDPSCPNHRLSIDGETDTSDTNKSFQKSFIQSKFDNMESTVQLTLPSYNPRELIGRSFLDEPNEDGQQHWVRVTKAIADHMETLDKHPDKVKFLLEKLSTGQYEKIVTYNEVLQYMNEHHDENNVTTDGLTRFKNIVGHQDHSLLKIPVIKVVDTTFKSNGRMEI